jgi:hypothetical protein
LVEKRVIQKKEFYKRIKIAGMVSFIPIILVTGPLAGYFIADFLGKKFGLAAYASLICIGIGLIVSIREVVRIIRMIYKIDKGS